jgi:hypothetical protein
MTNDTIISFNGGKMSKYECSCGTKHDGARSPFFCPSCVESNWGWKPEKKEEPEKAERGKKKKVHVIGTPPPKVKWGLDAEKTPSAGKSQYDQDG